eukprot:TRINITY_DN35609_c0_g1_i1.p1 TRINITY_DN35609_c0_g1~~TRINITY_DN35609_c0_g1_i1.p1  ORF type:complete len:1935 (+),score=538.56 TRINITY_DN35609_c0_g1_i1:51-5855(+)
MSFTLNVFDARRSGLKIPYALPPRQVSDDRRHEFASPFRWTKDGGANPRPRFLDSLPPSAASIDAKVQHLRSKALRILVHGTGSADCLVRYYESLREFRRVVDSSAPTGDIDPSLPNHEQDRLMEEREQHSALADAILQEQIKLLYNTALFNAKEAYKLRFMAANDAERLYQQAAAMFDFVATSPYLPEEGVPSELAPDFLRCMALCCLAGCAEHMLMARLEEEIRQWEPCAHLSYSISYYFSQVATLLRIAKKQMDRAAGVSCCDALINLASVKAEHYRGSCWWHCSHDPETRRSDQRKRKAIAGYESGLAHLSRFMPGTRKAVEMEIEYCIRRARPSAASFESSQPSNESGPFDPRPTPALQLPQWLGQEAAELAELRTADENQSGVTPNSPIPPPPPPPQDVPALDQPSTTGALDVQVVVPQVDLYHKKLPQKIDEDGNPLTGYHEIDLMATIKPIPPAVRKTGMCLYMIFDTFAPMDSAGEKKPNKIVSVQDLLGLLVKIVGLRPIDRVGVISWKNRAPHRGQLMPMTDEGQMKLVQEVKALQPVGNHRGSPGSSVVEGIIEALAGLESVDSATSLEVITFSDGFDATGATHYTNWQQFSGMRAAHDRILEATGRTVRLHTFALGQQSERYLLKSIAKVGKGDFSYAESNQDGLSTLRSWFLRHVANQISKVATKTTMQVTCAPGVRLRQMNRYDLVFDPTYVHQFALDPEHGEMHLEDFSEDHTSNVVMTLGVPEDVIKKGTTDLLTVTLSYREAQSQEIQTVSVTGRQEASSDLVSRELHHWLPVAYVTRVESLATISGSGGGRGVKLSAGDVLDTRDCIEVSRGGRVYMMTADDSRLVVVERSSLVIKSVEPAELRGCYSLAKGSVFVVTGQEAEAEVVVMEPRYRIVVASASYCKVEFDQRARLVRLNCMGGKATIYTQKEEGDVRSNEVLALQQTQMTDRQGPLPPWAIEEESYREWLSADGLNSNYLQSQVSMGAQICRTVVAEWIGRASEWLYKGSWDRLTESQGNRRCREFLIRFWLTESKHFLTNNIAGLASETEVIRKYVDKAIGIAMGDRSKSRDRNNLYYMLSASLSLLTERAKGLCDVYTTPLQQRLFTECADAKAKEEREREAAERDRQRLMKDSETHRREKGLIALFPLCDLDGVGMVYYSSINQVVLALEAATVLSSETAGAIGIAGTASRVLSKWGDISGLREQSLHRRRQATKWNIPDGPTCNPDTTGSMAFDEKAFVKLWLSLTEDSDGAGFNAFADFMRCVVEDVAARNEGTRRGRATYALFRKWDTDGSGWVPYSDLENVMRTLHGSSHYWESCWAQLEDVISSQPPLPPAMMLQSPVSAPASRKEEAGRKEEEGAEVDAEDTNAAEEADAAANGSADEPEAAPCMTPQRASIAEGGELRVTLRRFHLGMEAFFKTFSERVFHRAMEALAEHLASRRSAHRTVTRVVKYMNRASEKEHLLQWDLRHVFDGILPRDLSKMAQISMQGAPLNLDHVAAPVCILCGLNPIKTVTSALVSSGNDDMTDQWWEVLRGKVARDAGGFIDFLRNFPIMGISYRQVLRVLNFTGSPEFDSCRLLSFCRPLAHLCDWVRIVLKVSFLEHDWDFTNVVDHGAQLPAEGIVEQAAARPQKQVSSLKAAPSVQLVGGDSATVSIVQAGAGGDVETDPKAEMPPLPALPAAACSIPRPQITSPKPHATVPLNRAFTGVIEADDPVIRATARFSHFSGCSPDPAAGEVTLPDRRDPHTPLVLRRQPIAAVTSEDGLSSVHLFATPTPNCPSRLGLHGYGDSATPSVYPQGDRKRVHAPRPPRQPPRPRTAPISGRPGKRPAPGAGAPPGSGGRGYAYYEQGGAHGTPTPPVKVHAAYSTASQATQVSEFLDANGLGELVEPMKLEGYDDIVDLRDLAAHSDTDFQRLVPKPGHRAKLGRLLSL